MKESSLLRTIFYAVVYLVIGKLAKKGTNSVYRSVKNEDPPSQISDPNVCVVQVILWTVITSIIGGLTRLAFQSIFPETPPELEEESSSALKDLTSND